MVDDPHHIIENCRDKISMIDREIFLLIKQREQLSATIGQAKRDVSIPDRDFKREKIVFDRAIALATELNLPEKFAIALQKLIIEASVARQEQDRIKNNITSEHKAVLVVGGSGRLGQWLARFFADSGHRIFVLDPVTPAFDCTRIDKLDASANTYDIIVVATPIRISLQILEQLGQYNITHPVIFDVSSVKSPVQHVLIMLKNKGGKVTSLHPMFGPSVELLFGKHIIRTSLGVSVADDEVNEIFKSTSLNVVDMSIDEHDKIISILLSMPHLVNLVFVSALRTSQFSVQFLERFSSPTFSNLLAIAKKVYSENPQLYFEIQALNPFTKDAHYALSDALNKLITAVAHDDEEQFVAVMTDGDAYLRGQ